ncbi:RTC4-like domain-containing protein [Cunninghamella echinulata]|nr:RTC4-like domain-containing protein [Cunninghamella echinulata]
MKPKSAYSTKTRANTDGPFDLDSHRKSAKTYIPYPKQSKASTVNNTLIPPQLQNNITKKSNDNNNSSLRIMGNNSTNSKSNDMKSLFAHSNTKQPEKYTPPSAAPSLHKPIKIPSKKRSYPDKDKISIVSKLIELDDTDSMMESKKVIKCPYCHDILNNDSSVLLPKVLQEALDKIKNADQQYDDYRKQENYHNDLPKRRRVTNMDQFTFCQLHQLELKIKPEGIKKGYPIDIDFIQLETRVKNLHSEILKLINQETSCHFRTLAIKAYSKFGKHKARNTISVMNRFEDTLPGYYGPKGAAIMMNTLTTMFLHTGIITKEKVQPQLPVEYIQQVLVPETGLLLIQEDINNSKILNKGAEQLLEGLSSQKLKHHALSIMTDSREFGNRLYPTEDDIIDSTIMQDTNKSDNGDDEDVNSEKYEEQDNYNEKLEFLSSDEDN